MKMLAQMLTLVVLLAGGSAALAQQSATTDDSSDSVIDRPGQIPTLGDQEKEELERARLLLSTHHELPAKKVFEEQLEEPRETLTAIAVDEDQLSLYRKQALAALGYWPDVKVYELYTEMLGDDQTPENMRHRLILLLADHFPEQALGELEPYLSDEDLQFRLTAIEAIGRLDTSKAVEALEEARTEETNDVARERLDEAIEDRR
ncbi:MAG: HEAT repeat domain-containing protein [Persicimonas sp.]